MVWMSILLVVCCVNMLIIGVFNEKLKLYGVQCRANSDSYVYTISQYEQIPWWVEENRHRRRSHHFNRTWADRPSPGESVGPDRHVFRDSTLQYVRNLPHGSPFSPLRSHSCSKFLKFRSLFSLYLSIEDMFNVVKTAWGNSWFLMFLFYKILLICCSILLDVQLNQRIDIYV
jgi:hypothetical protein